MGPKTVMNVEIRVGVRASLRPRGQRGQVLLMYLIFLLPMTMMLLSVYNVGMLVSEKTKVQNAADNAAYSAAVWEARYMNLTAYINRAMVANIDTLATFVGLWSSLDAWDGFLGLAQRVLDAFFGAGEALNAIHVPMHLANKGLSKAVGGSSENKALGYYIEMYNKILSYAQQALYFLNQAGRPSIIQSIAHGVDGELEYSTYSEILNAMSLDSVHRWSPTDSSNGWSGEDDNKGLRLTAERSLNELSRGESLRDADNFLPEPLRDLMNIFNSVPCWCPPWFDDRCFGLQIGPNGYNAPCFDHVTGSTSCSGDENNSPSDDKTTIIRNDKLYQHDHSGLAATLLCIDLSLGHHSDDAFNLPNSPSLDVPHVVDDDNGDPHVQFFSDNGLSCTALGVSGGSIPGGNPFGSLSQASQSCGAGGGGSTAVTCDQLADMVNRGYSPSVNPFDPQSVADGQAYTQANQQCAGGASNVTLPCSAVQNMMEGAIGGLQSQLGGLGGMGTPCVTSYEWETKMNEVNVTTYKEDQDVLDGRRIEGPTVFVYLRKQSGHLPLFRGLGLTDPYDVEAYAFAKVYYTQRPGGAGNPKKETFFNPFWAARLERPRPLGLNFLLH